MDTAAQEGSGSQHVGSAVQGQLTYSANALELAHQPPAGDQHQRNTMERHVDTAHEDASRGEDTRSAHAQGAMAVARSGPADSAGCTRRPEHAAHRHASTAHGDTCVVHVPAAGVAPSHTQVEVLAPASSSEGSVVEVSVLDPPRRSRVFMSAMAHSDRTMQVRLPAPQQAVLLSDALLHTTELLEEPSLLSEASWEGGGARPSAVVSSEAAVSVHGAGFGSACVSRASTSGSSRESDGMCLRSV